MPDFDIVHGRSQSASLKWDKKGMERDFGRTDLLPFQVADMEFRGPRRVTDSLVERANSGIYGYEARPSTLTGAIVDWYAQRHAWSIDPSHFCFGRNVMNLLAMLINMHSEEGDGVITQPPVFFEFRLCINANNREQIRNPLLWDGSTYRMDFDDLENRAADPRAKLMILCNPHNPVGRVWEEGELRRVGEICHRHGVLVIADEIHGDFVYSDYRYRPYASVVEGELAQKSLTCLSPAKTFNISSVTEAAVVIPDQTNREMFEQFAFKYFVDRPEAFSTVAMETAYRHGAEWLDELLAYLQDNVAFTRQFLQDLIPKVKLVEPQGTFLLWLDFRELGMDAKELEAFLAQEARIALSQGYWFGRQGAGYARMTIACPRTMLEEGLQRLEQAVSSLD
jgi:cystathionine beta-lyase